MFLVLYCVGKCLLSEEGSEIVVLVDESFSSESKIIATYDTNCSSSDLLQRVRIEPTSTFDECRNGRPAVQEHNSDSGRTHLVLVFDSSECYDGNNEINILAIAIAVPIAVLVIVVAVIVITVPSIRNKVFPFANNKRRRTLNSNNVML